MLTLLGILAGVLVVLLITAATGYFVAQEFAYMAVDRSRLKSRAEAGDAGARRALGVTRRTSFMLSGAQLGITVTGLLVGYVAEPLIGSGVGELLSGLGFSTAIGVALGTVAAVLLSTVVQMVFGELFPKNLAIARPEPVARRLAWSTTLYLTVFGWLIRLFDASSNLLLRMLRIEPVHDVEHSATPRDLEHIVAESREAGELPPELSVLLDRILDFPTRNAEHAMVPRAGVDTVAADEPVPRILARMSTGHTRYPVVGDSADDLLGVVHLHDLLGSGPSGATAGTVARPAVIVPATVALPEVLTRLLDEREEMALVIDEYGGFAGIVTLEDMAEELVGEIADEHDPESDPAVMVSDGDGWLVRGAAHLDEISRVLEHTLPEGDYETLAGLLMTAYGGLPDSGDIVTVPLDPEPAELVHDGSVPVRTLIARVDSVDKHVPSSVRLSVRTETPDAEESTRPGAEEAGS